ncbi:MAG: glycoside hydrolase family 2 [Kiritimatiellae bacterium]|nr:glycoside hydrolase family 2 [Kiritimatiellia bacterium]
MYIRRNMLAAGVSLLATGVFAALDEIELKDWTLQDAAVVEAQAKREGWFKYNSACQTTEGEKLSLNGYDPKGWYKATVPGTVLTTLVDNGVYPEPTYGENNRPEIIPDDLCRKDWWYRTKVRIPDSFKDKTVWLNFDGINYHAEIWVNGRITGRMTGAFKRRSFDLAKSGDAKAGKDISIAVRISPQPTVGTPSEHTMGTTGGPCGGVARLDGPVFGCCVGWDWLSGVRDREAGLWRKVTLSATGDAKLLDPQVVTDLPSLPKLDTATVCVNVPVRNLSEKPLEGTVTVAFDDVKVSKKVALGPSETKTVAFAPAEFAALRVKNPKLWWPNGLGEPALHDMKISLEAGGKASDGKSLKFGIRKFDYFAGGKPEFALAVNGVRVFMKGGNWGLDEMLKRVRRDRIDAQVRLHREENFNMIRDWGGMSQSEELFDACDRYGILLWEDFWQFNSIDPVNTDFYFAHVKDTILRFRNHASLVIWCARNEATPPKYLDDEMRFMIKDLDPTRHYQANSGGGYGFNSGGPYDWAPPARFSRFMDDTSWKKQETFKTEIGGVSIPTIESLMSMFPKKDWEGFTDAWAEHNMCAGGGRKYPRFMTQRYGEIRNFADFARKAQLMNYETHRAIFEGRIGRMFEPMEGVLLWMSIPAQPSLIWQSFTYDLDTHATYFGIKKGCETRHVFFNESAEGGIVQAVNHGRHPFAGKAKFSIYNLDASLAGTQEFPVKLGPAQKLKLGDVKWPEKLSKVHFMKAELFDSDGKSVSDNFYWHNRACNPANAAELRDDNKIVRYDDLRELDTLPAVTLEAKARSVVRDGKTFVAVDVVNPSKSVALMAHFQLRGRKSGKRVLPTSYSDNYISLLPGEKKRIVARCDTAQLEGDQPFVTVDGWNVTVTEGAMVGPNGIASPDAKEWAHQKGFGFLPKPLVAKESVRINCGGYNRGNFEKDPGFLECPVGFRTEPMDLSECPNAGPADMYRTVRWGESVYSNLLAKANAPYTVRLHFAESEKSKCGGKNMMDVLVNGVKVLADFDPAFAGLYKAGVKEIKHVRSDAKGYVNLSFVKGKKVGNESRDPRINGYEIIPE